MENRNQIYRKDGKGCFLEIKNSGFAIGRVVFNFVKYDATREKGKRVICSIPFYLDIDDFLALAENTILGRLKTNRVKLLQAKNGSPNYTPLWKAIGGTSAEKLKMQDRSRLDGKSLSRQMKILPVSGKNNEYLVKAECGPGTKSGNGIIIPDKGPPESYINIGVTDKDLIKMFSVIKMHIQAFWTSQYIKNELMPEQMEADDTQSLVSSAPPPEPVYKQ